MSVLGKIFVILNLLVSVATAALLLAVYAARTNWHDYSKKLETELTAARGTVDAYQDQARLAREESKKNVDAVTQKMATAQADLRKVTAEREEFDKLRQVAEAENAKMRTSLESAAKLNDSRQKENAYLNDLVQKRTAEIKDMSVQVKDFRDKAVAAELLANTLQGSNNKLLTELESLSKVHQQLQASRGAGPALPGGVQPNPPAHDVEGIVKEADARTGFVTISIGSDAGIAKGNTLYIYRLQPTAKYLGTLQVLEVKAHEAVGKLLDRRSGPIQVNDRVAPRILGS